MHWHRPYKRFGLFLLVFGAVIAAFSLMQLLYVSFLYPDVIPVPVSKPFTLSVPFPITLHVKADRQNIVKEIFAQKWFMGFPQSVKIQSHKFAQADLELRFFGVIPFRDLSLQILEQIRVIPGGQAIGVLLSREGVIVVGMISIRDNKGNESFPGRDAGLEIGDIIVKINNYAVNNTQEVPLLVNRLGMDKKPLYLTIRRRNQLMIKEINPLLQKEAPMKQYKLGLYIQDPAAGVGTLTFYDTKRMLYGALGHTVKELDKKSYLLGNESSIIMADIIGIQSGNKGEPGEKIGIFKDSAQILGSIGINSPVGVFGKLNILPENNLYSTPIPVAFAYEVREGPAEILTVLSDQKVERFDAEIIRVNRQTMPQIKSFVLKITDERLLAKTGGIIQGMSGSPVLQNNQLVGAVTHVFVNDPTRGYGVYAEWMVRKMVEDVKLDELLKYLKAS
ncbi:MAG: SpoIVB peptidase [Bacillota bacterium]